MVSLKDLREEESKLLTQESIKEDYREAEREKGKIRKRIFVLKHPNVIKVIKVGKTSVKGIGMMVKMGFDKARPYLEQGAKNFAGSASVGNPFESHYTQKKIVRVKKVKRKRGRR